MRHRDLAIHENGFRLQVGGRATRVVAHMSAGASAEDLVDDNRNDAMMHGENFSDQYGAAMLRAQTDKREMGAHAVDGELQGSE
jgi:hypothetical protein